MHIHAPPHLQYLLNYATNLQYTSKSVQAVANSNVDGFTKYPVTSLGVGYYLNI